jgi:hypothetical protein
VSGALEIDPAVHLVLRAALALLFIWAAAHKLRGVTAFRAALADYALLPRRWLGPAAALLIAAELSVAAGLWLRGADIAAAAVGAGLLAIYAGAIAVNLQRGRRDIDCGCMGVAGRQPLSSALVGRNLVLAVVALLCTLPTAPRELTWVDGLTIVAGVVTLALLYAAVDGLLAQAPQRARRARRFPDAAGAAARGR